MKPELKSYDELDEHEKAFARERCWDDLQKAIYNGVIIFDDKNLQERIDKAFEEANDNGTPWFAMEFVREDAKEELDKVTLEWARDTWYAPAGTNILTLNVGPRGNKQAQ